MNNSIALAHLLVECCGLILVAVFVYNIMYQFKKYNLERWIEKSLKAANSLFDASGLSKEKRDWVIKFLDDNGLNRGFSTDVIDALILSTANELQMKNSVFKLDEEKK